VSIVVSGLTKVYGEQHAVDAISFEANPGDVLGFLGPNGAGKSTTMKMITGYIPPSHGKASVCGFDVETQAMEAKKNIGYLPENNPLYPEMYVKEFLLFAGRLNGVKNPSARAREMIQLTGLQVEQNKKIGALSKGYRQRVGLAQALLHNPKVLVMDEPTSGLDPNQLVEVRRLIKDLGTEKTVVFSTHIMQEVQAVCNRVIIINKGKIAADYTMGQLNSRSKGGMTLLVEFKQPVAKSRLLEIPKTEQVSAAGVKWKLVGSEGLQEMVFDFAVKNQLTILSLSEEKQSVEEIFRELTGGNEN
jgi:ABC-2 type transport system ATP-binding protein